MDNQQIGIFVTPDGKMVSASHGQHGFTVDKLVEQYGEAALMGMVILMDNGNWVQEGFTGVLTAEQIEALELLAGDYPEEGIRTAAQDTVNSLKHAVQPAVVYGAVLQAIRTLNAHRAACDSMTMLARTAFDFDREAAEQINGRL